MRRESLTSSGPWKSRKSTPSADGSRAARALTSNACPRFHIRRLSTATWGVLRDMAGSMTQKTNAAWRAFQEGVVNVDGLAADIVWPGADLRKTLTAEDMREIERVLPRPFILEVGAAVLVANADLTDDEKKTSDS